MGASFATERRLLAEDELGPVQNSHYPALDEMPHDDLVSLARWLRERHGRARDIIRGRRRVRRGKAEPRGTATESASERGLQAKKQVFARGLKRVNARLAQIAGDRKRERAQAAMREALARREAQPVHHPQPGRTAHRGMAAVPREKRRGIITGGRVGSVSQQNKSAQAARDSGPGG
ncbi:hypothetical protein [Elioraea rosea]|uniref:hypothetical protein n=1 Tax=Elioraea rosea TaxID=2492390 RepID=UPI0011829136|nr:hypothetical protein [Elioraea rosea]